MSDRTEWLQWRRSGIGASDVPAIVLPAHQRPAWSSQWRVWAEKMALVPDLEPNEDMEFGRWAERMIGPWFEDRTGLYVLGEQTWCTHPDRPTHLATADGFVVESRNSALTDALGLVEMKAERHGGDEWADGIPVHYQAQGQWQMHVTGLDRVWFAVLHGRRLAVHELTRDQADIDYMVATVDAWWNTHIVGQTPPPPDASPATTDTLAALYPGGDPDPVEVDPTIIAALRQARRSLKDCQAVVDELENAVKATLADRETGTIGGTPAVTWRAQTRRGGIDDKAMTADGIDLDKYRKPDSTYRVLRLSKEST